MKISHRGNIRQNYHGYQYTVVFLGPEQGTCEDPIVFEAILY